MKISSQVTNSLSDFDVTGEEFLTYLEEKCPDISCPACGSKERPVVAADSADGLAHFIGMPIVLPNRGTAHGVCMAFCGNCGHAWQFWANEVLNWAVEQRSKVSDDE